VVPVGPSPVDPDTEVVLDPSETPAVVTSVPLVLEEVFRVVAEVEVVVSDVPFAPVLPSGSGTHCPARVPASEP
jgi:hypothetical protein